MKPEYVVHFGPHGELRRLLDQWARWARTYPHYATCGSAEKNWKSPQVWDEREPRPPEINLMEALAVERSITSPALLPKWRIPLVWHHVYRAPPAAACRFLRRSYAVILKPREHEEILHEAQRMVANRLTRRGFAV